MERINIGGVPEHFNLPIHLAKENGWFKEVGIDLNWVDFPGGSGDMKEALRSGSVDVCILLTEGITTDIIKGNPSKIISGYVKTALTWGIHTSMDGSTRMEDIFNKRIAISRLGSGSHLMPIVHAMMKDKSIQEQQFLEIKDILGGIQSLQSKAADVFYWEKFTTKPHVENGELKRIGEFVSPWPCFMIAATNNVIQRKPEVLNDLLKVIYRANTYFMNLSNAPDLVSERYGLTIKDASRWYHGTEWSVNGWVSDKMLEGVLFSLTEAGIIDKKVHPKELIWERNRR